MAALVMRTSPQKCRRFPCDARWFWRHIIWAMYNVGVMLHVRALLHKSQVDTR